MVFSEKKSWKLGALLLPIFFAIPSLSFAADYKVFQSNGQNIMTMNGRFEKGESQRFKRFLHSHPETQYVLLQSYGGYVNEAMKVGHIIHQQKLNTAVETYCYSSCFLALMGGDSRYVYQKAYVGIHRPFFNRHDKKVPDKRYSKTYTNLSNYLVSVLDDRSSSQKIVKLIYDTPTENVKKINKRDDFIGVNYYQSSAIFN